MRDDGRGCRRGRLPPVTAALTRRTSALTRWLLLRWLLLRRRLAVRFYRRASRWNRHLRSWGGLGRLLRCWRGLSGLGSRLARAPVDARTACRDAALAGQR